METMELPESVRIREVGPRDGLQAESPVTVADRVRLVNALAVTGLPEIEAVAFVSPTAVPAMAGAADVMAGIERQESVSYMALVPNLRGAQLALESDVDGLTVTVSASPTYNEKNVRMTIDQSVAGVGDICRAAGGRWVDVVVSCAFGSPYEGDIPPAVVTALSRRILDVGATSLTLADTTGMATPRRIAEVLEHMEGDVGLHLHDTRGTALVNAYAGLEMGVRRFDTAVGGLGGSPFADGAGGNLATEDFVHLLDDLGIESGVNLDRLLEASRFVAELVGHPVPSRIAAFGPRSRLAGS